MNAISGVFEVPASLALVKLNRKAPLSGERAKSIETKVAELESLLDEIREHVTFQVSCLALDEKLISLDYDLDVFALANSTLRKAGSSN